MADVKEYIVRIKGDTSQLEAAADRAQAKFEKLSDTEVRLKVNFGKNNADIKPLLNEIKKVDPEVHTKMVIDGLDDLKQAEDRLEQIKKIEKDIASTDSMFKTLSNYSKEFNEAEKEAGKTLDDSKTIGILKEALNYIESIGKAADDVSIQPFVKGLRQAAEEYEDQLKGFKPENLLSQKDEIQNRLSSLSKNIGSIPEQDQIEARISNYIDELYGIEDRIDAGLESDSSNLIKKLKEASDYLDQMEKKYGKIEGSDLVDELKGIRRERATELDDYISRNSKGKKKEKTVKNKEIEKKDEPIDDDTFDSWLDEIDQETKKTEKLTEARKEAANASKEEIPYESHADEIDKESEAYRELADAKKENESVDSVIDESGRIGDSAKESEQRVEELKNTIAELMSIVSKSGKFNVDELIRSWIASDKDIAKRLGIDALLERSAVFDKDGNVYGGHAYGEPGKTGVSNETKQRMKSSGIKPWAEFHSHSAAKIASASESDFIQFIKDYNEYGVAMQGVIAQEDIELFDMAAIMRDHKDKLDSLTKEDLTKIFKEESFVKASGYFEDFIAQYASNSLEDGLKNLGVALKNNGVDINLSNFKSIATEMMRDPNNKSAISELLINAVMGSMKDPSALNSQLESVIAQHTSGSTLASYFGYNDEDIQHYRRKTASKSVYKKLFGADDLDKYIRHYTPDEFIDQNPLRLPDLSSNESDMRSYTKAAEDAADARARLNNEEKVPYESHADEINEEAEAYKKYAEAQRLAAIQNEYSRGMGVESEGGFNPEKQYMRLNELAGEYEQTMREIDSLQYSGSNNEDIKERIAMLKLLAEMQIKAFANSIPNDMTSSTAIMEAFGYDTPKIWNDYINNVGGNLLTDNEDYINSLKTRMLSLWRELPQGFTENLGDKIIDPNSINVMSSLADEMYRIKEARDEAHDAYQRQLDEEAQELAEKKAREEEYRREQEEAAREAAEEERRIAEEQAQREAEIEEESRRYAEKQMEEYERQTLERIELEKKVRDANEQALKEQESQYSPAQEYDVFADQYAEETEGERQLASAINERAEATEKATLSQKNLESQNVVDNIIKQQEAIKKYNQELYESKGMTPATDDYDSYYNSDGVGRYIEQTREAREETERLNDVVREGFVQDDSIVEQTENLNKNTEAVKKNADANKEASDKKDKIKAEGLSLDKQASLQRLDALEQKLKEVGIASKELEDGFANAKKAIADAADTSELANANKRIRNLATEVNAKVKRRQVEVDYSSELSALGKIKTEIVESSEASSELKAKAKDMFEAFSNSESFAESNVNKLKSAIKDLNSEFKESKKEFATRNTTASTRMSGYIDRLNSYNPDKYTAEVREKMAKLREDLTKLPRDAAGNFKIDLDDENVAKQVAKIDAAMNDLKESVRSADGVLANGISVKKLNQQMAQFVDKNHRLTDEYKQDIKELREALNDDSLTKSGYMDVLGKFKDVQARAADEGLIGGVGNLENLGNQIKRMSTNFVAQYFSLYDVVRYARELGQTVTEINSAQTELRKVSDASQTRIQENFKTSAETAQEMGATISDIIASTSDWARLGYSVDDAETLARNTALYQSVGDNMTQESASEYLTSIMKGYQLDADQSESIIDKVNEVANNYSIDTQGLGEALQRSASAFNTAHTDLDKSIAIITASNEVLNLWHAA